MLQKNPATDHGTSNDVINDDFVRKNDESHQQFTAHFNNAVKSIMEEILKKLKKHGNSFATQDDLYETMGINEISRSPKEVAIALSNRIQKKVKYIPKTTFEMLALKAFTQNSGLGNFFYIEEGDLAFVVLS